MLVIEGADLVGKTTLAMELIRRGTQYGPAVYRKLGLLPGHWNYKSDYINMMSPLVVIDRFYLSELIYGRVCRNYTPLTDKIVAELNDYLGLVGGLTLIITADNAVLDEQYVKRGDDMYKLNQIKEVNAAYIEYAGTHDPTFTYHYHVKAGGLFPSADPLWVVGIENMWHHRLKNLWSK